MGNYISCTLASPIGKAPSRATKVIFPSDELRHIYEPTKAAELMLERDAEFFHCQHQISANREKIFCSERRRRTGNWKCVRVFSHEPSQLVGESGRHGRRRNSIWMTLRSSQRRSLSA
ncbi:hypothetical protein ACS0TY_001531 [Phlomoides rotata]